MPKPRLLIASDLLFKDWGSNDGELWLSLRPHLVLTPKDNPDLQPFADWIATADRGAGCDYDMLTKATVPDRTNIAVQPVTFPSDVNISIAVVDPNRTRTLTVDRANRLAIDPANVGKFQADNRIESDGIGANNISTNATVDPHIEAFARSYVLGLQDANKSAAIDVLAAQVQQALTHGRHYRISDATISGQAADPHILRAPGSTPDLTITSIHCMLGHLVKIGTRADLAALQAVTNIRVVLAIPGQADIAFDYQGLATANQQSSIASFFQALSPNMTADVGLTWSPDLASRAYAEDHLTAFPYRTTLQSYVGRRESQTKDVYAEKLGRVRRFRVNVAAPTPKPTEPPPAMTDPAPGVNELVFTPQMAVGVHFSLYRGFPKDVSKNDNQLLALKPRRDESDLFWAEINRAIAAGPNPQAALDAFFAGVSFLTSDDAAVASPPRFVFYGQLPWTASETGEDPPTLVFFGQLPAVPQSTTDKTGSLTMLVNRASRLTATRYGEASTGDLRWEASYAPGAFAAEADSPFHILKLTTPGVSRPDINPNVGFGGDVDFTLAQSLNRVEAVASVSYPYSDDAHDVVDVSPEAEFEDDLVSFVTMRLERRPSGEKDFTPIRTRSNIWPVYRSETHPTDTRRSHTFQFLLNWPKSPVTSDGKGDFESDPAKVAAFYSGQFARASNDPTASSIKPRLAHLLGPELRADNNLSGVNLTMPDLDLPAPLDHPVVHPNSARGGTADKLMPDPASDPAVAHFLRLQFNGPADPIQADAPEVATLCFATDLLRQPAIDPATGKPMAAQAGLFTKAWMSVAELCDAETIIFRAVLVRFNFYNALKGKGTGAIKASDGLEIQPEDFKVDLTKPIKDLLQPILSDPTKAGALLKVAVTLSSPGDAKRLYKLANAVEFRLDVTRQAGKVPSTDPAADFAKWKLVRVQKPIGDIPAKERYGQDGLKVESLEVDPDYDMMSRRFIAWLRTLYARSDGIDVDETALKQASGFRGIVGRWSPDSDGTELYDDWVVPPGVIDPIPGAAGITIVPLGFRPLKLHPSLAGKTDFVYGRYLAWLQVLIDCSNRTLAANYDFADWRTFFSAISAVAPAYETFIAHLADLALPLHEPAAVDEHGASLYSATVRDTLSAAGQNGAVRDLILRSLKSQLLRSPRMFFDAKAFLYSRLDGAAGAATVPASLYRLQTRRSVLTAKDTPGKLDLAKIQIDDRAITVGESLGLPADTKYFGFLETLLDSQYEHRSQPMTLVLDTFEGLIDKAQTPGNGPPTRPAGSEAGLRVPIDRLEIPDGVLPTQADGVVPDSQKCLYFASRRRVAEPQFLAGLVIEEMKDDGWVDRAYDDPTKRWSLAALKRGKLLEASVDEPQYTFVSCKPAGGGTKRLDDPVTTLMFMIEGDEEAFEQRGDWQNCLDFDQVKVEIAPLSAEQEGQVQQAKSLPAQPTSTQTKVFANLLDVRDPRSLDASIVDAIDPDVLKTFSDNAVPNPIPKIDTSGWPSVSFKWSESRHCIIPTATVPAAWLDPGGLVQAHLLRVDVPQNGTFVLVLNVELPVWQRYQVRAAQSRNMREAGYDSSPGSVFAIDFGMVSDVVSVPEPLSISADQPMADRDVLILPRSVAMDVPALLQKLLIDRGYLDPSAPWKDYALSITVSHEQRVKLRLGYVDESGQQGSGFEDHPGPSYPTFPLSNYRFDRNGPYQAAAWFEPDVDHYQFDIHWTSPKNLRFFGYTGIRVEVS